MVLIGAAMVAIRQHKVPIDDTAGVGEMFRHRYLAIMLIMFTSIILLLVGSMALYHTSLIQTNQTTHEDIKNKPDYFNAGRWHNIREALFIDVGPSAYLQEWRLGGGMRTTTHQTVDEDVLMPATATQSA